MVYNMKIYYFNNRIIFHFFLRFSLPRYTAAGDPLRGDPASRQRRGRQRPGTPPCACNSSFTLTKRLVIHKVNLLFPCFVPLRGPRFAGLRVPAPTNPPRHSTKDGLGCLQVVTNGLSRHRDGLREKPTHLHHYYL